MQCISFLLHSKRIKEQKRKLWKVKCYTMWKYKRIISFLTTFKDDIHGEKRFLFCKYWFVVSCCYTQVDVSFEEANERLLNNNLIFH